MSSMEGDYEVEDDLLRSMDLDFLTEAAPPQQTKQEPSEQPALVPHDFSFPFEPYNIQVEFMKNLYQALEQGKVGIFESPTGTVMS